MRRPAPFLLLIPIVILSAWLFTHFVGPAALGRQRERIEHALSSGNFAEAVGLVDESRLGDEEKAKFHDRAWREWSAARPRIALE